MEDDHDMGTAGPLTDIYAYCIAPGDYLMASTSVRILRCTTMRKEAYQTDDYGGIIIPEAHNRESSRDEA